MDTRDQLWLNWFLGIFGTAGLFLALALMGMSVQHEKMGWLSFVLGAFAFLFGPWFAVASWPRPLTGGIVGLAMGIGAIAILIIFASIYEVEIPPLAIVAALFLSFLGGSLGEPNLGTA
ncbi:MAG TPA: hypothetical protein VFE37_22445 [Chloroflexota bacterium]|nr:hypothetical protein [Chloroflexota bacterium]